MGSFLIRLRKDNSKKGERDTVCLTTDNLETCYEDEDIYIAFKGTKEEQKDYFYSSEDQRYHLIFTGTIYNAPELRDEILLRTSSTAALLIGLFHYHREKMVPKLRGMFAILIWDAQEKLLFGARDFFGIKSLYCYEDEDALLFTSDKKLYNLNSIEQNELESKQLQFYLSYQYIPEPYTLSRKIIKLQPGHYCIKEKGERMGIISYWRPNFSPRIQKEEELANALRIVLRDSVEKHMRSEETVGSFLSGGIDSSLIASIAKQYNPNLKTFSIGFETPGFSELEIARETANTLGTNHTEIIMTVEDYVKELPNIIWHLDEPLADPSCVPLYFLAREARKDVSIVLSGEGADELFGGYNIYKEPQSLKMFNYLPSFVKRVLKYIAYIFPEGVKGKSFIERGITALEDRYIGNALIFKEEEKSRFFKKYEQNVHFTNLTRPLYEQVTHLDPTTKMQYIDIQTWLPGDILLKAEKMPNAHSLEVRMPFLDRKVFDLASTIPIEMKIAKGTTKYILRRAAEGIVPDHVLQRKKLGFPVPLRQWLKNEMYEWCLTIILKSETDYLFHKPSILSLLEEHRLGKMDYSRKIWTIITFMLWHSVFVEKDFQFLEQNQQPLMVGS